MTIESAPRSLESLGQKMSMSCFSNICVLNQYPWRLENWVMHAYELGNYAEYSGATKDDEVLQYARVVLDYTTVDPDGRKRALIGRGIANFTNVASTFNGIIRALREKLV